jgi:hypothetical protein
MSEEYGSSAVSALFHSKWQSAIRGTRAGGLGVDRVAFCGKDGRNSAGGMAVRRRKMS